MKSAWPARALGLGWGAVVTAPFLFLAACGSGADTATPAKDEPFVPRAGLKFGYYFGNPLYMAEQADHVNTWWAVSQGPVWHASIAEQLRLARLQPNIRNIVLHFDFTDPVALRFHLGQLSDAGLFNGWDSIVVYPMDEPDMPAGGNLSDAVVTDRVVKIRQVMFDTPGLLFAKIGVFYQCASGRRPGIKSFDLVGCYRYEASACAALEADYASLRAQKVTGALLWTVPGGASINGKEGNLAPLCWASYGHRFADVWGVMAFMWQSGADPNNIILGIRENGRRKEYCEAGQQALRPTEAPAC